jgi:outer membrane lipoprotein carrier protein
MRNHSWRRSGWIDETPEASPLTASLDEIMKATPTRPTRRSSIISRLLVAVVTFIVGTGFTLGDVDANFDDLTVTVATTSASAQSKPTRAETIAEDVQDYYKKTKDFESDFDQVYTDIAAGTTKKSHGTVYFKKSGMMRWDYKKHGSDKRDKLIVSDGNVLWVYQYKFKQVFKRCLQSSKLPTALSFLMGEGNLLEQFDISMASSSTESDPVLEMVPKKPTSKYKKIEMEIDPESNQVERTKIFDPYGNTNEFVFDNRKVNQNLPDSGFDFKPPKDARLLNPQKKCP